MMAVCSLRNTMLTSASLMATALLLSNPAVADIGDPAAAQKYEAGADALVAKGDYKAAVIELKNAKKADPQNSTIHLKLAAVELRLNDLDGAEIELQAARENSGDEAQILPLLARTYLSRGKFDQLLQETPVNLTDSPEIRAETLAIHADALIGLGRIEDARAALTQALALAPSAVAPKLTLARLDLTHDKIDDAEKTVDEILKTAPSAEAHYLKGDILARKDDKAGALTEFGAALAADPNNLGAYIERAQIYIGQGDDAKAAADIKSALALSPRSIQAAYYQALLLVRAKDYAGADTILTKTADGFASLPRFYYLQAVVKSALKQYEQADKAIDSYLAAVPNDPRGIKTKADILMSLGEFNAAAQVLRDLTAGNPTDAEAFAMLGRATALIAPERSTEAFEKSVKLDPDDKTAQRGLAFDHLTDGQYNLGGAELEKFVQQTPNDTASANALVLVYIQQKQYDKAGGMIADLIRKNPNYPVAADALGVMALSQGRLADAKTAFEDVARKFPDFIPAKLQAADIDLSNGHPDQARGIYQAILTKDPGNLPALKALSGLMIQQKQPDQLVELWRKSYRAQPDNMAIERGLISAYVANHDLDGALSAIRDMQLRQPREAQLYKDRADIQAQNNQTKDAIESLRRLIELQPMNPAAWRDLALLQEKTGALRDAANTIAEARKRDPANVALAADEVRILGASSPDAGIAAARRLAASLPDEPTALAVEGDYLETLKRPADALAAFQRAFQALPSLFLADCLSKAAVLAGTPAVGEKVLTDWVAAHPQDLSAQAVLAAFLQSRKNFAAAKTVYEALLKEQPGDASLLNNLALIYQHDGDPRALDIAQKAQLAAPQDARISDTLGWIMTQRNDPAGGLAFLQRAHNLMPGDLDNQYHLAFALNRVGRKDDAAALLKRSLSAGIDFESKRDAQDLLGQLSKG
jgi:putative PEP-CTERM system TPR-repeat lipoprotein